MSSFSHGIRNWQLNKLTKTNPKQSKYPGYKKVQSILFLCDTQDGNWPNSVFDMIRKSNADGKEVYSLLYCKRPRTKEEKRGDKPTQKNTYFSDQKNWFGKPKLGELAKTLPTKVDVIIDFTLSKSSPNDFIFAAVEAKFTVGIRPGKYDLTVSLVDQDMDKTVSEINQLLKLINK